MSVKADAVLAILQSRYDYYSARAVLSSAAASTGIKKDGPFDGAALATLADAIRAADDSSGAVAEAVRNAGGAAKKAAPKAAAPKAEPKKAAPKAAAAKAEPAKAEDAAGADKAPAKKPGGRGRSAKGKG